MIILQITTIDFMIGERKKVRITGIIQETRECKTFVLETIDNSEIVYEPGQFLTFIFDTSFGEARRNYSISSSLSFSVAASMLMLDSASWVRSSSASFSSSRISPRTTSLGW